MTITRFAPSPSGRLHIGNLRTALHCFLWARQHGGRFLLRIDDTDATRSSETFVEAIRHDLDWLGLERDGEFRQSERFDLYERQFDRLKAAGRVYACYETLEELDLRRKVLLGRGLPPIYERPAPDTLTPEGRTPHWRFRLDHDAPIAWHDLVRGAQQFDPKLLSDPVVRRADGSWLYLLPSVIDDIDMGVTTVVRGEDHVSNTASQLQMFEALGAARHTYRDVPVEPEPGVMRHHIHRPESIPIPRFAHTALLVGSEGKLSKRLGSLDCDALRAAGIEPLAIAALLARLGTSDPVEPVDSLAPLVAAMNFAHFGRAPARFDLAELEALNAKIVHGMNFDTVAARLPEGMDADAWTAIRPNLSRVADADDWWAVVTGPIASVRDPADRDFLAEAAAHAASLDWTADPWQALTNALKTATGRSGKALFLPLRRAVTGRDHGPDMATLLPVIGRDEVVRRLSG